MRKMKKLLFCLITFNVVASEDASFFTIYTAWIQSRDSRAIKPLPHSWCSTNMKRESASVDDSATAHMVQIEETIKRTAISIAESITE
jgi:hypothetical protein